MKAKRGDTSGLVEEFLMEQALADKMLNQALAGIGDHDAHYYSFHEEAETPWEDAQTALELGAQWRPRQTEIKLKALKFASLRQLRALESLGLRLESADPLALGTAAARVGYAPWLNVALDALAKNNQALPAEIAESCALEAGRRGQKDLIEAFEAHEHLSDSILKSLARNCAANGRWKMCAKILKKSRMPEAGPSPRPTRAGRDGPDWMDVWGFCVSMAAGRASEAGTKALLRAWRDTPEAPWSPNRATDAQMWMGRQDPLLSASRSRNARSGERVAAMLVDAGLEWKHSFALPYLVREGALRRVEAVLRQGASVFDHEGDCALAAAESMSLPVLEWADKMGVDFSKLAERDGRDPPRSALSYLRKNAADWEGADALEIWGRVQAMHDARQVRAALAENQGERFANGANQLAKPKSRRI